MAVKRARDPSGTDFPHGTLAGYDHELEWRKTHPGQDPCAACRTARTRRWSELELRRMYGRTAPTDRVDAAPVVAHVLRLRAVAPSPAVAAASGVTSRQVQRLSSGKPSVWVTRRVSDALLAVTPESLSGATPRGSNAQHRPASEFLLRIQQMNALGYPAKWQMYRLGWTNNPNCTTIRKYQYVSKSLWDRQSALLAEFGDTAATPEATGLSATSIVRAKKYARRKGAYPPAYYDEDTGELDWRSAPGHPAQHWESKAARLLEGTRVLVTRWQPGETILAEAILGHAGVLTAEICGTTLRRYQRIITVLGVQESRRARDVTIRRAREVLDRYDNHEITALHAAYNLNLIRPSKAQAETRHPGVTAWQQQQQGMSVRQCQLLVARLLSEQAPMQELAA